MGKIYIDEKYSSKEYLVNQPYVFKENRMHIALKFVEKSFDISDISRMKDEEIKKLLIDTYKYDLIKNLNGEELYNKISEVYLGIKEEPKKIYEKYMNISENHLNKIEKNIEYLNSMLNKKKIDRYHKRKIEYYLKKNKQEIENIKYFRDNKIKKISYMESLYPYWNETGTYRYAEFYKGFYIENEYNIRIKFYKESIDFRKELEVKYRNNKEEYYKDIDLYLDNNPQIFENMIGTIENEYYLRKRKNVLKEMMKSFKIGNKEVFINLVAIQIEGIFEDYCISIGALKEKNTFTLVEKVRKAEENIILYGYEYFAFDFPKIRNKIAHAKIIKDDIVNLANELFLDLNYVLNLFNQKNLDTNIIRNFIQNFENTNKDVWVEHVVKSINNKVYFEFLFGNKYDNLLKHYDLMKKREELIHQLNKDIIWNNILEKIKDIQNGRYNKKFHDDFKSFLMVLRKKGLFTEYTVKVFDYFNEIRIHWEYGFVTEIEEDDEDWYCNWWKIWQVK